MGEIVVDVALLTGATMVLGFVLNQGYKLVAGILRKKWPSIPEKIPQTGKKIVVFLTGFGLVMYSADLGAIALPDPAVDPAVYASALAGYIGTVFKAAQEAYDHLWKQLVAA